MVLDESIFKAFDIRGSYPEGVNETVAFRVGQAFGKLTRGRVVVGFDARLSSPSLARSLIEGITSQGVDVVNIGFCTTPQLYFAANYYRYLNGVMVTASHAPKTYNGFKFVKDGLPLTRQEVQKLKNLIASDQVSTSSQTAKVIKKKILADYVKKLHEFCLVPFKKLRVVMDAGNGAAGPFVHPVFDNLGIDFFGIYLRPDGNFPHHGVNPLLPQNRIHAKNWVKAKKADLGIIWDGDTDRVYFLDSQGEIISPHFVSALIGQFLVSRLRDKKIVVDVRTSRVVKDLIKAVQGEVLVTKAWHTEIKFAMQKNPQIIFGSETSGHYVFRDFYKIDDGMLAALMFLQVISATRETLPQILARLQNKYFIAEEENFELKTKEEVVLNHLADYFKDGQIFWIDGLTVEYPNWRFNLRASETEPFLRLNLEANSERLLGEKTREVTSLIEKLNH